MKMKWETQKVWTHLLSEAEEFCLSVICAEDMVIFIPQGPDLSAQNPPDARKIKRM